MRNRVGAIFEFPFGVGLVLLDGRAIVVQGTGGSDGYVVQKVDDIPEGAHPLEEEEIRRLRPDLKLALRVARFAISNDATGLDTKGTRRRKGKE